MELGRVRRIRAAVALPPRRAERGNGIVLGIAVPVARFNADPLGGGGRRGIVRHGIAGINIIAAARSLGQVEVHIPGGVRFVDIGVVRTAVQRTGLVAVADGMFDIGKAARLVLIVTGGDVLDEQRPLRIVILGGEVLRVGVLVDVVKGPLDAVLIPPGPVEQRARQLGIVLRTDGIVAVEGVGFSGGHVIIRVPCKGCRRAGGDGDIASVVIFTNGVQIGLHAVDLYMDLHCNIIGNIVFFPA